MLINIIRRINRFLRTDAIPYRLLLEAVRRAGRFSSGVLLDVGCGSKPYRHVFEDSVDRYIGLDLTPDFRKGVSLARPVGMPKIVRKMIGYSQRQPPMPDIVANALALPFKSNSVDTLLASELIEHIADPGVFLSEARRVLKDGGVLILTAPFVWFYHESPCDYLRFTRWGLEHILGENGLRVLSIMPYGTTMTSIGMLMSCSIDRWAGGNLYTYYPVKIICLAIQWAFLVLSKIMKSSDLPFGNLVVASASESSRQKNQGACMPACRGAWRPAR
jgi:SAM-dependent methyltransferase